MPLRHGCFFAAYARYASMLLLSPLSILPFFSRHYARCMLTAMLMHSYTIFYCHAAAVICFLLRATLRHADAAMPALLLAIAYAIAHALFSFAAMLL